MRLSWPQMMDIPPIWLAAAAAIAWLQVTLVPMGLSPSPLPSGFGTALIGSGCIMIVLAAWELRRHKTTIIPHLQPNALVNTGIFSKTRNPIYLADAIILAGLCLRWGAYPSLVLVPLFGACIQARFIVAEEARLASEFGDRFAEYARLVRRWF